MKDYISGKSQKLKFVHTAMIQTQQSIISSIAPESLKFWKRIEDWIANNLDIKLNFTICEVIFGIHFYNTQIELEMINFIVLIAKWYINKVKTEEKSLYFINFIELLKDKIQVIITGNKIHSRINKEWHDTLSIIL